MSNTLFIGKVYHRFDELPSTNDWAAQIIAKAESDLADPAERAKTRPPEGTVVRADNQTAGRGQLGSQWHSQPGENLLLSAILYPIWLEVNAQFYLSMAVALALYDTVLSLKPSTLSNGNWTLDIGHSIFENKPSIKWPNDLYLGGKKSAGILIQNALSGSSLQSSIVGIGLNVNQLEFPSALPHATSLARAFGQHFDLEVVLERLFECLENRYLQLKAGHRAAIKTEYEAHLWRRGIPSRFVRSADEQEFVGQLSGVSEQGLLQVETKTGLEEFEVKALRFVL